MSVTPHMVDRVGQQVARLSDARSPEAGASQALAILNAIAKTQPGRSDPEAVKQLAALIKPTLNELGQFLNDHLRDVGQAVEQRREKRAAPQSEPSWFRATFTGGAITEARTGQTHQIEKLQREVRMTSNGRYVAKNGDVIRARQGDVHVAKRRGGE